MSIDTTSEALSDDVAHAVFEISERLRTKSIDQVIAIGERTGWWFAELVDWVADGHDGPPPPGPVARPLLREEDDRRLAELEKTLAAAGVVQVDDEPAPEASPQPDHGDPVEAPVRVEAAPGPHTSFIAVLKAAELGVDHSYQRPLEEPRVKRMATDWDPRMVGVIDVSDRGPDASPRYAVINGQHRAAAAARVSPAGRDVALACNIHEGLDVAAEARLMHELDRTTKKLSGWDKWNARRGAGDPVVLQVEEIAARHGLKVSPVPADGSLRSYGAAEKLLTRGGENLLDSTLTVLSAAYGALFSAYQAPLVSGVGQLLQVYGSSVNLPRLTRALRGARPEQLRAAASALRDIDGGQLSDLMTRAVLGQYNRTPGDGPRLGGARS